ncbi:MAG: hypothetical protein DRI99_05670 [Candidatus Aminicenantes bacterium]|nr:MAG: hypothetical protein DRI99_05670 [Candidatus Aminicenantes bacterium]RLE04492.1 MAG: hypothetical protein DRJ11_01080 [Candidatus Aminicenantes bacterium]HHF42094.1 hypothetical protein [Candidatus Aminicenantes bacterium]
MNESSVKEIKITLPEELFSLFLPEETRGHLKKAKIEFLRALRSLIDARIAALEKKETTSTRTRKKVPIK